MRETEHDDQAAATAALEPKKETSPFEDMIHIISGIRISIKKNPSITNVKNSIKKAANKAANPEAYERNHNRRHFLKQVITELNEIMTHLKLEAALKGFSIISESSSSELGHTKVNNPTLNERLFIILAKLEMCRLNIRLFYLSPNVMNATKNSEAHIDTFQNALEKIADSSNLISGILQSELSTDPNSDKAQLIRFYDNYLIQLLASYARVLDTHEDTIKRYALNEILGEEDEATANSIYTLIKKFNFQNIKLFKRERDDEKLHGQFNQFIENRETLQKLFPNLLKLMTTIDHIKDACKPKSSIATNQHGIFAGGGASADDDPQENNQAANPFDATDATNATAPTK